MTSANRSPLFWLLCLTLWLAVPAIAGESLPGLADTRALIDVSGSMKKNDPDNLRRPALRLLVGLLPQNSRAGVWTFGQYVNMQVPLGKVDEAWRVKAREGAGEIHSRGLFTNIEDAIKRSIADWKGVSKRYRRHLILLTDGMVDVSKDPLKNQASRQHILEQLLPRLKESGARVYTIALSERADHELMQTLSRETGGWYEQVSDAGQLQRVFLRIFEKVGRPDTVPLKGNRFHIDDSIREATLLVFRAADAAPTQVTTPGGNRFDFRKPPGNVRWHRDEGYDLMTISAPEAGEWQIEAATDPDNRVMVVTDLKMMVSELPPRVIMGGQSPVFIQFTDQAEQITAKAFLDVVNVQAEQRDAGEPREPRPLFDDGQGGDEAAGDGTFSLRVGEGLPAGRVELIVNAEGRTFQREQHQVFELVSPVSVLVTREESEQLVRVRVQADVGLMDPRSIKFDAVLASPDQDPRPVMMLPVEDGDAWEAELDRSQLAGAWTLGIRLSGTTIRGAQLDLDLESISISGTAPVEPAEEVMPEPEVEPTPEPEPVTESQTTDLASTEMEEEGWVMDAVIFAAGNLLALVLVASGYWLIRRRRSRQNIVLLDDEFEEETDGRD